MLLGSSTPFGTKECFRSPTLAAIYGVETKILGRAVYRNAQRFPAELVFRLAAPIQFGAHYLRRTRSGAASYSGLGFTLRG
jgi:hypothetical protein